MFIFAEKINTTNGDASIANTSRGSTPVFKVGEMYQTRAGLRVEIIKVEPHKDYPIQVKCFDEAQKALVGGSYYILTAEGDYWVHKPSDVHQPSNLDIVGYWQEPDSSLKVANEITAFKPAIIYTPPLSLYYDISLTRSSVTPEAKCQHAWKTVAGFTSTYTDCTLCGAKLESMPK